MQKVSDHVDDGQEALGSAIKSQISWVREASSLYQPPPVDLKSKNSQKKIAALKSRYFYLKLTIEASEQKLTYSIEEAEALRWVLRLFGENLPPPGK